MDGEECTLLQLDEKRPPKIARKHYIFKILAIL
jgi:hypothetical protein